jgi:hypothetical protein
VAKQFACIGGPEKMQSSMNTFLKVMTADVARTFHGKRSSSDMPFAMSRAIAKTSACRGSGGEMALSLPRWAGFAGVSKSSMTAMVIDSLNRMLGIGAQKT